jgi:hypothetical protein
VTKRYDEAIDVTPDPIDRAPIAFQWRGRQYEIDERLTSWREAGEWWNGSDRRDREYHRVLARPAGTYSTGDLDADGFMRPVGAVFDVYLDRAKNDWILARVWD